MWYLTRSSALVAFVLMTAGFVLGLLTTGRTGVLLKPRTPRFISQALHRNITLMAIVFVLVHVVSTVLDGYVRIGWPAAIVPFTSGYRTAWVAAGTAALDLAIMLAVTSLLRVRIGLGLWRGLHWFAYALWPLAVTHYLGTGTDVTTTWGTGLAISSIAVVTLATLARVGAGLSARRRSPRPRPERGDPVPRPSRPPARPALPARGAPVGSPGGSGSYARGSHGLVPADAHRQAPGDRFHGNGHAPAPRDPALRCQRVSRRRTARRRTARRRTARRRTGRRRTGRRRMGRR
jgi:sulfoxide reductase heme-binding subunit YedZ